MAARSLRPNKIPETNPKRLRQLGQRFDGWIARTALQPTQVLLAETRNSRNIFLRHTSSTTDPRDVSTYHLLHIHVPNNRRKYAVGLSTIICYQLGREERLGWISSR